MKLLHSKNIFISKNTNGFTLVELLIVMSILGVLAVAGIVTLNPLKLRKNATDAKVKSTISQLSKGIEAYYQTNNSYPPVDTSVGNSGKPDMAGDLKNYVISWPSGFFYVRSSNDAYCVCGGDSTTGNTGFWFGTNTPTEIKSIASTDSNQCSASFSCPTP